MSYQTIHVMKFRQVSFVAILCIGIGWGLPTQEARAQEAISRTSSDFARNSIFLELLGNGLLYSLNYDYKIFNHLSARAGGMYLGVNERNTDQRVSLLMVPIMANYLVGNGSSRLEVGAGLTVGRAGGNIDTGDIDQGTFGLFTSTIGYRLQPTDGGFLFRIGFTPVFTGSGVLPWAGLSLGGTF